MVCSLPLALVSDGNYYPTWLHHWYDQPINGPFFHFHVCSRLKGPESLHVDDLKIHKMTISDVNLHQHQLKGLTKSPRLNNNTTKNLLLHRKVEDSQTINPTEKEVNNKNIVYGVEVKRASTKTLV